MRPLAGYESEAPVGVSLGVVLTSCLVVALTMVNLIFLVLSHQRHKTLKRRLSRAERALQLARTTDESSGHQRSVLKGQLAEQLLPLLPGFPFHPSDFRFLGQPIDFVVFRGLTDAKEGSGTIEEIVIGDIKTGNAQLSKHQRMIRDAVVAGRVRWETIRVDADFGVRRGRR